MQVHQGKHHSENCECGLFDLEIGGVEYLEIHLNIYEAFQCDWDNDKCKERFKTLIEIKKHFGGVHNKEYVYLLHLKLDRNDNYEVSE